MRQTLTVDAETQAFLDLLAKAKGTRLRHSLPFTDALDLLYATKFTGRVSLDFAEGRPKGLGIVAPQSITLT